MVGEEGGGRCRAGFVQRLGALCSLCLGQKPALIHCLPVESVLLRSFSLLLA